MAALLVSLGGLYAYRELLPGVRADARAAIRALEDGDLAALAERLAAHRGRADFAYYFAEDATPRALGDVLAGGDGTTSTLSGIATRRRTNSL